MKRFVSGFLALVIILAVSITPAFADSSVVDEYLVYLDDGYYMVCTIYEDNAIQPLSVNDVHTKSGRASANIYNSNDEVAASITVVATFEYDGKTAEAITATYGYSVYASGWEFESGSARCVGDTAIASVTFSRFLLSDVNATVTLTCSPTGVLS